jgi:hypothetical protein
VGILLVIATLNLDIFFYNFLRTVVSIGGAILIYRAYKTEQKHWYVAGGLAIFLFNRWFGFEFPKETWFPIDLIFASLFFRAAVVLGRNFKNQPVDLEEIDDGVWMDAYEKDEEQELIDSLATEKDDENPWKAIAIIAGILLALYLLLGIPHSSSGCENWVQDPRGGYCES